MKKLLLILIISMILVGSMGVVWGEDCSIARPYFGSVNCEETSWSQEVSVYDGETWSCDVENCEITDLTPNDVDCSSIGTTSRLQITNQNNNELVDCDATIHYLGDECAPYFPVILRKGDQINVDFSCNFGEPEGNPRVLIRYKKLELELNIDSGRSIIPNTEFCNMNEVWSRYSPNQLSNNNALKSMSLSNDAEVQGSDGFSNIPSSSNLISDLQPTQLNYKQGYWFIYDWVERPSLMIAYYNDKPVWCNPIDHSLTQLEEVNTRNNDCYLIPTSRLSTTVECCSSDECKGQYVNQAIYCTDDFKCGFEKSCLSDVDCGGTSETCQEENGNYYLVSSSCDKSELDSYNKGSCASEKDKVKCCEGSCSSGEYCDYEKGCTEVTYKSSKDEVKTGIKGEKIQESNLSGITGAAVGSSGSSSAGIIIVIIIVILIAGAIGFYFFNKKKGAVVKKVRKTSETQEKKDIPSGNHCAKCGSKLKENSRFCTKCGSRIRK